MSFEIRVRAGSITEAIVSHLPGAKELPLYGISNKEPHFRGFMHYYRFGKRRDR